MIYLNLGCGANRPQKEPWINIDNLYDVLPDPKQLERIHLAREKNYIECDITKGLPFEDNGVHGIVASHLLEHFKPIDAVTFLRECKRVLSSGGVLRISVPDPELMLQCEKSGIDYYHEYKPDHMTFIEYVLTFGAHFQIISQSCLEAMFYMAGFSNWEKKNPNESSLNGLASIDNRISFSLFMEAVK
jgi:predicted SAM-dependent methyltransferase